MKRVKYPQKLHRISKKQHKSGVNSDFIQPNQLEKQQSTQNSQSFVPLPSTKKTFTPLPPQHHQKKQFSQRITTPKQPLKEETKPTIILETHSWDFDELAINYPALDKFVFINAQGRTTIDWTNPLAHKTLNQAILAVEFGINSWDMPTDQLIPAIPSRLSYLQWISQTLNIITPQHSPESFQIPPIRGVDIGTGASLIYPLLGVAQHNWTFISTESCESSYQNACKIVEQNKKLTHKIDVRLVSDDQKLLEGIIKESDGQLAFTMSNPPFFERHEDKTKWMNASMAPNEYLCTGGEVTFIQNLYRESIAFAKQIKLFTSLVGRHSDYIFLLKFLKQEELSCSHSKHIQVRIHSGEICLGNTTRWILAWTFNPIDISSSSNSNESQPESNLQNQ